MCRLCDWGEMFPQDDPADLDAATAAAERQAASRRLWAQLMSDIGDEAAPTTPLRGAGGD